MAKPIKMTPVLSGKDAVNFLNIIKSNSDKKASREYLLEIRESARKIQSLFKNK